MNAIVQQERVPKSVLIDMSNRFNMEPNAFEAVVRATCMRPDKNGKIPSKEEFAAFLLVAKNYNLNPLTKEIYAFAAKGGGIVPIVSLDGWANMINSHPAMDGLEFAVDHDDKGALFSTTCRIYRKDRSRPIEVTEYLSECKRPTEPWQMSHRMLRHKSLIQCARYAFGFSGIYDEDEAERFADMREASPATLQQPKTPVPPKPPAITHASKPAAQVTIENEPQKPAERVEQPIDKFLGTVETWMNNSATDDDVEVAWSNLDVEATLTHDADSLTIAHGMKRDRLDAIKKGR